MSFAIRAVLYVIRKRSKTLLLFCILILSGLLIVSSLAIMRATEYLSRDIEKNTGTKLHMAMGLNGIPVTEEIIAEISGMDNIAWINRASHTNATPDNFSNIPGAETQAPEYAMVQLHGYDDAGTDGPFADQLIRLESGELFAKGDTGLALIHSELAATNGLKVGDALRLNAENGGQTEAKIAGIYHLTAVSEVGDAVESLYRPENQIYATQDVVAASAFDEVFCYLNDPAAANDALKALAEIGKQDYEVSVYDALYNEVKGSLEQTRRIVSLMLYLTVFVTAAIITLILSLWMRSRTKEIAVFISLGEHKCSILMQSLLEVWIILGCVIAVTALTGNLAAQGIAGLVMPGMEAELSVSFVDIGYLGAGGIMLTSAAVILSLLPVFALKPRGILTITD